VDPITTLAALGLGFASGFTFSQGEPEEEKRFVRIVSSSMVKMPGAFEYGTSGLDNDPIWALEYISLFLENSWVWANAVAAGISEVKPGEDEVLVKVLHQGEIDMKVGLGEMHIPPRWLVTSRMIGIDGRHIVESKELSESPWYELYNEYWMQLNNSLVEAHKVRWSELKSLDHAQIRVLAHWVSRLLESNNYPRRLEPYRWEKEIFEPVPPIEDLLDTYVLRGGFIGRGEGILEFFKDHYMRDPDYAISALGEWTGSRPIAELILLGLVPVRPEGDDLHFELPVRPYLEGLIAAMKFQPRPQWLLHLRDLLIFGRDQTFVNEEIAEDESSWDEADAHTRSAEGALDRLREYGKDERANDDDMVEGIAVSTLETLEDSDSIYDLEYALTDDRFRTAYEGVVQAMVDAGLR